MIEASAGPAKVCAACGARYPADALFCPSDGTPLQSAAAAQRDASDAPDPYLGQEISGHIEIRQLVGIGAMGRVYRAFQRGIDRDVAVKILHRELSANAQLVSRFTREAKVASRLQHPNVVQVLLAGQLPDRALYMVMEYLDGLSLQSAFAGAGGAFPLPRALHVVTQLCEAVGEAHAQGIVHRDLKPENVMLVRRGPDNDFVKVLDFGIARINWGEQSVATAAGLIFGTARYISPEGAQGNAVTPASDVYSIATLLYQMLSGRTPFEGDQAVGLLVQQIHDPPPPLKSIARSQYVPAAIADVVMANLAKDPQRRELDARALGHAILDAAKSAGLSPDDFARPLLRRSQQNPMNLPPNERTKQLDLTPDLAERLAATPSVVSAPMSSATSTAPQENGATDRQTGPRAPMAATAKWEPPGEFQARLAEATRDFEAKLAEVARTSVPDAASEPRVRAKTPSVDETLNDPSLDAPAFPPSPSAPSVQVQTPALRPSYPESTPVRTSVPKTMPGDESVVPRTQYETPSGSMPAAASRPNLPSHVDDSRARETVRRARSSPPRAGRSRGIFFVLVCFALGALIAGGWAWRTGRIGDGNDQDRWVSRATDAMYKNRFFEPAGENVKDITDEGLRRFPAERRLLDIRIRAANELVTQALAHRSAGDVNEALRLARVAHDLDPHDASAKRLVDQYEAELANVTSSSSPPLSSPPPGPAPGAPSVRPSATNVSNGYTVAIDTSAPKPRLGQIVELSARVAPAKGTFEGAGFTITGPTIPAGIRIPAQGNGGGVFKAAFTFLETGRYEIVFTTQADGKPVSGKRVVTAGDTAQAPPSAPTTPPTPPTPSVKWM